jgi:hypothetical protein
MDWDDNVSPGMRQYQTDMDANRQAVKETYYSGNYFKRHWRGELSLPVSYWINGVVVFIAMNGVDYVLTQALTPATFMDDTAAFAGLTALVLFGGEIAIGVWSYVGIWRSAHKRGGGWGVVAQVMVVLGILKWVVSLAKTFGLTH